MASELSGSIWRQTLGDLLRRTAARFPQKPAIYCGEVAWTYAEFDRVCDSLAVGFASLGIDVGDRVAVLSRNSHAVAAVRFALARLGAQLVPINFKLNADEVAFILRHSGAHTLCVDVKHTQLGFDAVARGTAVEHLLGLPSEQSSATAEGLVNFFDLQIHGELPALEINGETLAQIIYTSGTESLPKGALLSHENVISQYVSCLVDAEIAHDDVILHAMPLYHCAQLDAFLGPGIYVGATNIITAKPAPDNLLALIEKFSISSFFSPPTIWISLLRCALFDATNLASLRKGYYGASIMPVAVLQELQHRLPNVRLWNLYGQTEIAPVATVLKPEDQLRKAGSAGRATLNVETRVVDANGNAAAVGEVGEIVHRSPQLMRGYYRDEERTRAAFAGDWFHSGDLGVIDEEGYLFVVDRKKDMIKSGGENVASREVEEVLYRLAQIAEVAVIGLPDPHWIEAVTAVIVLKEGQTLTEASAIEHCKAHLAHFKVPKRIIFADALPKSPSGKVLKRELRLRYQAAP